MAYDPEIHHRRSIRVQGFDYASRNAYFVTLCTQHKQHLFGKVVDGKMALNDAGRMIERMWMEIPQFYPSFELDAFQVMPNHFHGIIRIVGAGPRACPKKEALPDAQFNINDGRIQGDARATTGGCPYGRTMALSDIIHRFKTITTKQYAEGVKCNRWRPFEGRLWLRNYYEHIIRNGEDFKNVRDYIIANPVNWENDEMYETMDSLK